MRIKLFGAPSVWRGDVQIGGALAQKRRLALVSLLAAGAPPGRPGLPRERILELMWPGVDEDRARAALSQALYAVRRDLGADDAIIGSTDLRLNPERVGCDYWDFLQQLADGATSVAAELRTAPLLNDFEVAEAPSFGIWAEQLSAEVDRQWARAADHAAHRAAADGDLERTVRMRRALANADPLSNRTAIELARALSLAGEREAALRHLQIHSALVEQELDAAPSADVVELMAQLQRGEFQGTIAPSPMAVPEPVTAPIAMVSIPDAPAIAVPSVETPARQVAHQRSPWPMVTATAAILLALVSFAVKLRSRPEGVPAPVAAVNATVSAPIIAVGRIVGDTLGEAVSGMLATNLARAEDVVVVSNARMLELLQAFPPARSAPLAAARAAGANVLIEGALLRNGEQWRLALTRTAVQQGTVSASWQSEGRDVFMLVDQASGAMLSGLSRDAPQSSVAEVSTQSLDAWRLYQEARRSQLAGRYDAARAQLRGALAQDSTFAMAALTLASLIPTEAPEYREALNQAFRMRTRASPRDALLIRASWLADQNDPAAAAVLDTLAARYPDDLEVRMNLAGPALYQRGDFARAYSVLISTWNADSVRIGRTGDGRCYACETPIHLTTVAEHQDSLAVAERWLRRYLMRAPTDVAVWDRLAMVLERDPQRHREMAQVIEEAVRLGNTSTRRFHLLAATRIGDTAAFTIADALSDPTDPNRKADRHWSRAVMYRNVGRFDEALREARAYRAEVLRRGVGDTPPSVLEGVVHLERGAGRMAAAIFDSIAFAVVPGEPEPLRARRVVWNRTLAATARYEAGDTTGLFALADTLAVLGPRSRYVRDHYLHHHVRGLGWLARGRPDDAIVELQRAIVFSSVGFTRTNWYLAKALRQRGRLNEARQVLAAAARAPRDGSSLYLNPLAVRAALRELR